MQIEVPSLSRLLAEDAKVLKPGLRGTGTHTGDPLTDCALFRRHFLGQFRRNPITEARRDTPNHAYRAARVRALLPVRLPRPALPAALEARAA